MKRFLFFILMCVLTHIINGQALSSFYPTGVKIYPVCQLTGGTADGEMHGYTYTVSGNNCGSYPSCGSFQHDKLHTLLVNKLFQTTYTTAPHDNNMGNINWEVFNDHSCNSSETGCTNASTCSHKGIDFKASQNTNVYCPLKGRGEVKSVNSIGGSSTNKYVSVYYELYDFTLFFLHLQNINVSVGDNIFVGTKIGEVGSPNHCHLEVRNGLNTSAGASTNSVSPIADFFDARAAFMLTNSEKINQFTGQYMGDISNPISRDLFIMKSSLPVANQNNFSVAHITELEIRQGTEVRSIPLSRLSDVTTPTNLQTTRKYFNLDLQPSDVAGLQNNGKDCVITFRYQYQGSGTSTFFMGTLYFFNPNPTVTYSGDVNSTHWYESGVRNVAEWSLMKGYPASSTFQSASDVNKERVVAVIIKAGIKLGTVDLDTTTTNGTYADMSSVTLSFRPFVQTWYNLNYSSLPSTQPNFNPSYGATQAIVCRFAEVALNLTMPAANDKPNTIGGLPTTSFTNTSPGLKNAMEVVYNINKIEVVNINNLQLERATKLWAFWNAGSTTNIAGNKDVPGTVTVKNGEFALMMSNLYMKRFMDLFPGQAIYKTAPNGNNGGGNPPVIMSSITDFTTIGDIFDNSATPVGNVPSGNANGVTTAQFSVVSGGNITLEYPATNANSTVFYWSMKTEGGTLISSDPTHRKITYTAPTVTQVTTVWLYSYRATNAGKKYEVWCEITVNPTTPPTPTAPTLQASNLQVTVANNITNYIGLQWTRGNGQNCVVTATEIPNSQTSPANGNTYIGNQNYSLAPKQQELLRHCLFTMLVFSKTLQLLLLGKL